MKRILLLSLLLLPIVALAQYPTFSNKQRLGVQTTGDGLIFRGTTINNIPTYVPSNVNNAYFHLDTVHNKLYLYNANAWQLVYPSPQFDTTTLNVYLKISDTTAMLLPYFRDSDTTSLNLINRFALKLNISDTATMLTPYMKKADTISLSNRINLKLNISDTIILSNRITTNANNIITINNKLATKLDTIYVKFKNVVTRLLNKDTINIGSSLTDGYAINIIGDSVNIDTVILDTRYPDRDSTNELQDITFATTSGIVTISGGKVINLDTLYNSVIDSVNLLIRDSIAAFTPLTEGYGINIIGDSINVDTSIIFTQSDTITLSNRINTKLNASDTVSLSNRIDLKLNKTDTINLSDRIDLKLNKSDTISLSNRIDIKLNASDTVSLSNRINARLNISDTTNMLAPYLREADTINLSNRINTKLDTIYVNYQTNVDVVTNKDTINIVPLTEGFGINIIGDSINIDSAVILETQQKQIAYVKNMSGVTIYKGQAVYSSGSSGGNKLVTLASSNTESSSSKTFGIVETDSIPNGSHGYVITFGVLSGFNTNALTEGLTVYLSNTPGQLTSVKPIAPLHMVTIGICIRQQQNNGSIFVKIQNGFEFDELHDVRITTPVDKASIYYNLSENLWRDTTATLLISDTASMLNPYLKKLDTISLSNRIDLRVKYADTTNMLLPYFKTNDTTLLNLNSRLSIKLNLSDTANMLSKYVNTYSNQIDINGNKTFNNVVTIDSATVTGKLLVNTNISDAVKINSNTNSTNFELMNNNGTVSIKSTNRNMVLQTDTTALVYLNGETNRVGILTMTPEQALEVNGTIRVDSLSNNLTPVKIIGANNSNDLTNLEIGNGLFISNDTLRVADNVINSGDTATLLRQDFLGINTNVLTWQQGSKKLLPYFTQVYRNGQLLKSESQYTITNDSIVTLATGSFKLDDNITIIAIDNIIALAGGGGIITLQGDISGSGTNTITTTIGTGKVLNSMLAGSISDTKLNTITTAGKISNSATTATNLNTNNAIVSRDASGNFSAGTITASLNGNANTATTLTTGRTIAITGDLTYTSPSFNGSTNVTAVGTLANSGVAANTYTAATITVDAKGRITSASANTIPTVNNGTLTMAVSGNGLTGNRIFTANQSTDSTFTVTSNATNINTPSTIVYRDASGNFSAGNITANTFIGNATSSTTSTSTVNVLNYLNSNELFKFRSTNATNVSGQILVTTPGTDFTIARNDAAQTFTGTQTFSNTIIGNISGNAATVTTNANLTGDITSIGNATSIATGVIVNADINASAAIAVSKLAASTISGVTLGNNLNTLTISSPLTGTSYNGSSAVSIGIQAATTSVAGSMSAADKTKLDGIAAGATANTGTVTSVAALTLTTTGTDVSSSVATGTTTPVITLNIPNASSTNRGVLTSTDWNTFNNKQNALGFTPANNTVTINTTSPLQGGGDLSANRTLSILSASDVQSGIVNTSAQLFSGSKVFKHRLTADSLFYLNNTSPIPTAILGIDLTGGVNSVGKFTLGNGLSITSSTLLADTNLLVTRFDTASMLTPYLRRADTSLLNLSSRFASKQNTISLTTNETNGLATFNGTTLNIPNYTLSGLGGLSNSITSTQDGYFGNIFLYDDNTPSHYLSITNSANLTAARTLSINVNDVDRTISLSGNLTVSNNATVSGTNTGDQTITLTGDVTGTGTSSFSTTLASVGTAGTYRSVTTDAKGRVTAGTNPTTLAGYGITNAVDTSRTITINGTAFNLSANRSYSVGTVTSVGGTGTVSGLTLTGSVTNSGNLTLGGTLSLTSGNVTTALGYTPYNSTNPNGYIRRTDLSFVAGSGNYDNINGVITIPTNNNQITNGAGYITSSSLSPYATLASPTFTGTVSGITKSMIGLGNVDNTSDANKPVSTATQTALNLKVNISDTASMLTPYFRDADTTSLNLTSRFAAKLNLSDTASMLTNYLRTGVAASTYLPLTGGTLNISSNTNFLNTANDNANLTLYNSSSNGTNTIYNGLKFFVGAAGGAIAGGEGQANIYAIRRGSNLPGTDLSFILKGAGVNENEMLERLRIKFDGKVGIGTSSPNYLLDVNGQIGSTGFIKSGGTSSQFLKADGSVDNNTYLTTSSASSTYLPLTGGTLTGTLNGTSLNLNAGIDASGNFSTSYHTNVSALFRGYQVLVAPNNDYGSTRIHFSNRPVSESFSNYGSGIRHKWAGSDASNSFLSLYTSNYANLQIDAISIDALGNVGIMDTTPSYTLDVNGTINANQIISTSSSFSGRYFSIKENSSNRGGIYPYNVISGSGTDYSINLFSESEISLSPGGSATKKIIIANNGAITLSNTTSTTPNILLGKNTSTNVVANVTTVEQTGLMTRGVTTFTVSGATATFDVTHSLGVIPETIIITSDAINGSTGVFYEIISKTDTLFRVQGFNVSNGSPAINKTLSVNWLAIK